MFKQMFSMCLAVLFMLTVSGGVFAHPGHGMPDGHFHQEPGFYYSDVPVLRQSGSPAITTSGQLQFQMPRPVKLATPDVVWNPHAHHGGGIAESLLQLLISGLMLVFLLPVCTAERFHIARNDPVKTMVAAVLILIGFTLVQWVAAIFTMAAVVGGILTVSPAVLLLAPVVYFGSCILGWAVVLCVVSRLMSSAVQVASFGWAMWGALMMMVLEWAVAVML